MGSSMKIYVVAHKLVEINKYNLDSCYEIICVGKYGLSNDIGVSDSTRDNIAEKNPYYCELTAQYWIWKNDKDSEIVGLCHYRRYFTTHPVSMKYKYILNREKINSILTEYDAIVPRNENYVVGAYNKYLGCGYEKDLLILKQAIEELYPEYLPYYESEFENSAGFRLGNMIIASKSVFDEYSNWLFNVLEFVENRVDLTGYSVQEARIYGYMSERLLNVWLSANKKKCKSMRILNTEEKHSFTYYMKDVLNIFGIYSSSKKLIFNIRRLLFKR